VIGAEIIKALVDAGEISVSDRAEAELDVQAVLKEYLRLEREITDKAKDLLQKRNLPYEQFGRVKPLPGQREELRTRRRGTGVDDRTDHRVVHAIHALWMRSSPTTPACENAMVDILKKHMLVDDEIDAEVRRRIKNLEEGTATWEVEYQKALEQIKKNRRLDEK